MHSSTPLKPGHLPKQRRSINVFVLAMLSVAVVVSLRNLPVSAEYGFSSLFYYLAAALFFMIPYALVSAELASGWPKAGGVFIWVREALGDRWGFFTIWMQWFHNMTWYPVMLAFIAAGIARLINPALADNKFYLTSVILAGFWGVTFLNFLGIKTTTLFSTICVLIGTILPGALLIGFASYWVIQGMPVDISFGFHDFLPSFTDPSNIVFLAGIFLALSGMEASANLAREVKNPQKNYPRALFIGVFIAVTILALGSLAVAIVIPKSEINLVSGLLDAFHAFFAKYHLEWITPIIAVLTVMGAIGELNAWTIAGVKGLFVTTEHGCLPPILHKINQRQMPVNLLFFQAIIVTLTALVFLYLPNVNIAYWALSALSAQMYVLVYIFLFIAGIVLRYKKPGVHRSYKIPFKNKGIWIISILGGLSSIFAIIVSFIPPSSSFVIASVLRFELLLIIGLAVSCAIPLIIYQLKRPHWQLEVLEEIREDIHQRTH